MPCKIGWLVEGRVLFIDSWGVWTEEEYLATVKRMNHWAMQHDLNNVHVIIDNSKLTKLPTLSTMAKAESTSNAGWLILVALPSKVTGFLITTTAQLLRVNVKTTATVDEAKKVLLRLDSNLTEAALNQAIAWLETVPADAQMTVSSMTA